MEPFDEWVKSTTQNASIQVYADRLIELGASWDSFLCRSPEDIVHDLVIEGKIPILAARDIVDLATAAAKKWPMAIFWDLENMPIPTTSSGRDVCSRLKSILKPYGDLAQFRGYASIGLNLIPQQKRSDLQLSGCLLVDCPHNGRKEVADKMIIVDAMNFAMLNHDGATLVFVTGDIDYAYLLAVLQRYKQYRTIVISKGTLQSMLDVNCDMKMRWETDILQLRSSSAPTTQHHASVSSTVRPPVTIPPEEEQVLQDHSNSTEEDSPSIKSFTEAAAVEALTEDEEWFDDAEFLRNIVRREGTMGTIDKGTAGRVLRETNPARFPNRETIRQFLKAAIEKRVVVESDVDSVRILSLPRDETTGTFPAISLSAQLPLPLENVPERVVATWSMNRPYVLFVRWKFCPVGTMLPATAYVQHKDAWGFLLFRTLSDAQRAVSEFPWLRNGTLVDWRKVDRGHSQVSSREATTSNSINTSTRDFHTCALCSSRRSAADMQRQGDSSLFACAECIAWQDLSNSDKKLAASKVVDMLRFMARNDECMATESIVRKFLHEKDELGCKSRKWAALWIERAIETGLVMKQNGPRSKCIFLPEYQPEMSELPLDDLDTIREENHVLEFLRKNNGWADRLDVIESLQKRFPKMHRLHHRQKVFHNAIQKGRVYVCRSPYAYTVGLTAADAKAGSKSLESAEKMFVEDSNDSQGPSEESELGIRAETSWDDKEVCNETHRPPEESERNIRDEMPLRDDEQDVSDWEDRISETGSNDDSVKDGSSSTTIHNTDAFVEALLTPSLPS